MNKDDILRVLNDLKDGNVDIDAAYELIKDLPYLSLEHIKFDIHRNLRRGLPEVVYGEGKRPEDIIKILSAFEKRKENLIITRLTGEFASRLTKKYKNAEYDPDGRVFFLKNKKVPVIGKGNILVMSAGTADLPVAKEAELCARYFGNRVDLVCDVGIAGFHRVIDFRKKLKEAKCIIVVAGMEGALPSFIAAISDKPVIGVPTSVGYGANLGGITSLLGMLCNCSSGVTVVNIDNGFGAAYSATLINRL
jgi:NCAIR mutase (PurE)-related protein